MKAFSVKGFVAMFGFLRQQQGGNQRRSVAVAMFRFIGLIVVASLASVPSSGQGAPDAKDGRFHDDLLEHFVGRWDVTATVYGQRFTLVREVEWVMNHQYLRIHEKSREVLPRLNVPFERTIFIGYNNRSRRYVVYEMTVHGIENPHDPPGFAYAERVGNELKVVFRNGSEVVGVGRHVWEPASRSWRNEGRQVVAGKEQEPFLVGKAVSEARGPR